MKIGIDGLVVCSEAENSTPSAVLIIMDLDQVSYKSVHMGKC